MKYYTVGEFSKLISKTSQTLRSWDKDNILKPHHVSESGYRYYSDEQLNYYLGFKGEKPVNNMQTYLLASGKPFEIISDKEPIKLRKLSRSL